MVGSWTLGNPNQQKIKDWGLVKIKMDSSNCLVMGLATNEIGPYFFKKLTLSFYQAPKRYQVLKYLFVALIFSFNLFKVLQQKAITFTHSGNEWQMLKKEQATFIF